MVGMTVGGPWSAPIDVSVAVDVMTEPASLAKPAGQTMTRLPPFPQEDHKCLVCRFAYAAQGGRARARRSAERWLPYTR